MYQFFLIGGGKGLLVSTEEPTSITIGRRVPRFRAGTEALAPRIETGVLREAPKALPEGRLFQFVKPRSARGAVGATSALADSAPRGRDQRPHYTVQ